MIRIATLNRQQPRGRATLLVSLLLVSGLPLVPFIATPAQAAATLFAESFDQSGLPGWTLSGVLVAQDCSVASTPGGCSLNVSAQVTGTSVAATHPLNIPLGSAPYILTYDFRWEANNSASRSWTQFDLTNDTFLRLNLSEGTSRRLLSLQTADAQSPTFFATSEGTWYRARIYLDPTDRIARAEVRTLSGAVLATSSDIAVSLNATAFTSVTIAGDYSSLRPLTNPPAAINYDTLDIAVATPPLAPPAGGAGGPGAGQVTLTWTSPADDGGAPITRYSIYAGNSSGNLALLTNVSATTRAYTDGVFGDGVWRYYRVSATTAAGEGAKSPEIPLRTLTAPSAPRNLTATPGPGVGQVSLAWRAPADVGGNGASITAYRVYRGLEPDAVSFLAEVPGTVTSHLDEHLQNGTLYHYAVSAVNVVGEGARSDPNASRPRADQAFPPTGVSLTPNPAWTGDVRTAAFSYRVAASECPPALSCPVQHEWRIYQDGSTAGADGTLLASGTNDHDGHAQTTTYSVSVPVHPTGTDGTHQLKVAVNARTGSTQWNVTRTAFQIDAPTEGRLGGPTTPQLQPSSTRGGENVRVTSSYVVFQKQCRTSESCPVQNDWRILLDGSSPWTPDGTLLAEGSNQHPAHGTNVTYDVDRTVWVPHLTPGPHFIKVAARADSASPWRVAATLTDGIVFQPDLDDEDYVLTAGQAKYGVENLGKEPVWSVIARGDLPAEGHTGSTVWGTTGAGNYPPLSDGTLRLGPFDLSGASQATLTIATSYDTADEYDAARVLVRTGGVETLLEPATGPAYATLLDGERGWAGASGGWRAATFDLTPHAGEDVEVLFRFRSDALSQARGWFIDDVTVTKDAQALIADTVEGVWQRTGGWQLMQPTTGPGRGDGSLNAWSVAPTAPYAPSSTSLLHLPVINLDGVPSATLTFDHWMKMEYGGESARVEISPDGGQTWRLLEPQGGLAYEQLPDGSYGWSGNTLGWKGTTFELTPYVNAPLHLRFAFTSDDVDQDAGWYLSDFTISAFPPPPTVIPPFGRIAEQGDALYAYFERSGTSASVTTPSGETTTITYVGSSADVVARLAADGTVTARQALVGVGGPVSVPATSFTIVGPGFLNEQSTGTWVVRGASTLTGTGGTQLRIGGKVFDDVLPAHEPIDGTGLGGLSASGRSALHWNWHNQDDARYDASLTSATHAVETVLDLRLRYLVDSDGDGHANKEEERGFSDPAAATSTPLTDDDGDGVPNEIETSRDAAIDPFTTRLNSIIGGQTGGADWEHAYMTEGAAARMDGASFRDYDKDEIPDYADLTNNDGAAGLVVGPDPQQNLVRVATARAGFQVAILITPDWKNVVLLELGAPGGDAGPVQIPYDQFFAELAAYYGTTRLDAAGQVDQLLNTTLRQHLDESMSFTLIRRTVPAATTTTIAIDFLQGTPADGTWTIVRDTDVPTLQLVIEGRTVDASFPAGNPPNLGVLHATWFFVNVHNLLQGYEDVRQCVTYNVLLRTGACSTHPTTQGMRLYSPNATMAMRGLLTQLRVEYMRASLIPQVYEFVRDTAKENAPAPLQESTWHGVPTETLVTDAVSLVLPEGTLATGDFGAAQPRAFDWDLRYAEADPLVSGQPTLSLGIEPSDASTQGSTILVSGATLAALGFDADALRPPQFDDDHRASSSFEWTDADGDGVNDYVFTIGHFSKAWILWTTFNGPTAGDFSIVGPTRAFMTLGYPNTYVWNGGGWGLVAAPPTSVNNGFYQANAVHASGTNEAWFAGGNECGKGAQARGWVLKLTYNPTTPSASTWQMWDFPQSGTGCGVFYDVFARSSSDVWIAGEQGVFRWNGNVWTMTGGIGAATHIQFMDASTGYATPKNQVWVYRWVPQVGQWNGDSTLNLPFVPTTRPGSFQMDANRTVLWATGSSAAAYCSLPCLSWTSGSYPTSNHVAHAIYGHDATEAWSVGKAATGGPSVYRRSSGGWESQMSNWNFNNPNSDQFDAIQFLGKNEGWMVARNGDIYHYSGSNTAPSASFTADRSSATTIETVSVDGRASSDADKDPILHSWDWGDQTAGASGPTASHRYREPGNYTITLTVTDSEGAASSTTRTVAVVYHELTSGQPLTQSFTAASQQDFYKIVVPSGKDQVAFTLTGDAGTDFNLYVRHNAKPSTTLNDGSSTGPSSSESITTSGTQGPWYVMVRSNSGAGSYTLTATYRAQPTTPTITQIPSPQIPGQTFWLNGASTAESPVFYTIDWGDGTGQTRVPPSGTMQSGATYNASHSYGVIGDYPITVTVTDTAGLTNSNGITGQSRDVPAGSTNPAKDVGQTSATLVGTLSSLGGYSVVETWFEYGLTTSYGSSTPVVVRSATGTFEVGVSDLQTNSDYHYRLLMRDPMGTSEGGARMFHTVDLAPGVPTMARSPQVTSRNEILWVNGTGSDPEGDAIYFIVDWHDGTPNSRYPSSGTVPSGSSYSVSHGYAATGTYNVSVKSVDALGVESPYAVQFHDVVDLPTGTASAASGIGRTVATLHANVTSLGGDGAGILAWFEYGLQSQGFTLSTPPVRYTAAQAIAIQVSGLIEGGAYQYRLNMSNARGWAVTNAQAFTTNTAPTLDVLDLAPSTAYADTLVSFVVRYTDVDDEPPKSGYPRILIDGVATTMTRVGTASYASGATYKLDTTLAVGAHAYAYEWTDSLPDVRSKPGKVPSIEVFRQVSWADAVDHDAAANGLPSPQWARSGAAAAGPRWLTVNTPAASGLADAPDWPPIGTTPRSVSLWFGDPGTGTYANGSMRSHGSVLTPTIDLTQVARPALQFWTYHETEDNGTIRDTKKVYVVDAQGRETLLGTLAGPYQGDHKWWPVSYSLAAWEGQQVRVRFEFDSVDGGSNNHRGWFINELAVGTDRDDDATPDIGEQRTKFHTTWVSFDGHGVVAPAKPLVAHQWGAQHSFTDGLVSTVGILGSPCQVRVVMNTSVWSSTLLDGSCPANRGAGTVIRPEGNAFVLVTNLTQAGFPLRQVDAPHNVTLTVTHASGGPAYVAWFTLTASGHTQFHLRDSDGDGIADTREISGIGTIPLSRDPDNDGFLDGYDVRPFTPDDPPVIDLLDPGSGTWLTKLRAHVRSRWGIQDVRLFFTGTGGSTEVLHPRKVDQDTWEWSFPTDLGRVTSVRVAANDTFQTAMEMVVTYDASQPGPKTVKTDFKVFTPSGLGLGMVTAGAAVGVSAGATAIAVALAPEVVLAAVVIGILVVGIGALVVDVVQDTPSGAQRVSRNVRYPTSVLQDFVIAPGALGCVNTLRLLHGVSGTYGHRGAKAMLAAYPISQDPSGYSTVNQVRDRISTALQNGGQIYRLDAYTGVLMWVDPTLKIVERWQIHIDPVHCVGEIVHEKRTPVADPALVDQLIRIFGAASLWGVLHEIAEGPRPLDAETPKGMIHLLDAKSGLNEVATFQTSLPEQQFMAVERLLCHTPIVVAAVVPSYCPVTSYQESEGSYGIQFAAVAMSAAQMEAQSVGGSFLPSWYWWSPVRPHRGVSPNLGEPLDASKGVFRLDDRPGGGVDAYNDRGAVRAMNSVWQLATWPSTADMMRDSEQRVCEWKAANPGSYYGFLPIAIQRSQRTHVYVELAEGTNEFGYAGGC